MCNFTRETLSSSQSHCTILYFERSQTDSQAAAKQYSVPCGLHLASPSGDTVCDCGTLSGQDTDTGPVLCHAQVPPALPQLVYVEGTAVTTGPSGKCGLIHTCPATSLSAKPLTEPGHLPAGLSPGCQELHWAEEA